MSMEFHEINDSAGRDGEEISDQQEQEEMFEDFDAEEPLPEEPKLEQDRRTSGSFAEGQARLARALDNLTERLRPHLEPRACLMDSSDCGSNLCPPAKE
jgi:hypothetical protein